MVKSKCLLLLLLACQLIIINICTSPVINSIKIEMLNIYNQTGNPLGANILKYNDGKVIDSLRTGDTSFFVAKLFSDKNEWLSVYETDTAKHKYFHWTCVAGKENGIFGPLTGIKTWIIPINGSRYMTLSCQFNCDSVLICDTVKLYLLAGDPIRYSCVCSVLNINSPATIDTLIVDSNHQVRIFYAFYQDIYNNIIAAPDSSNWLVSDTSKIDVRKNTSLVGEFELIRKNNALGQFSMFDQTCNKNIIIQFR